MRRMGEDCRAMETSGRRQRSKALSGFGSEAAKRPRASKTRVLLWTGVALAASLAPWSRSQAQTWMDPTGGRFQDDSNWSPASVPGSGDTAIFGASGTYTVNFSGNVTNAGLRVREVGSSGPHVTFDLRGHTYSLVGSSTSASVMVGESFGDDVSLDFRNGNLSAGGYVAVGRGSFSTGTLTIGSNATWSHPSSTFYVGYYGNGTLNIENGGYVTGDKGMVGYTSNSTGHVTVRGSGSEWNVANSLYGGLTVGGFGTGTLRMENGGKVSSEYGTVAYGTDALGEVTVAGGGSRWLARRGLYVGKGGDGSLLVEGGGEVATGTYADVYIGQDAGSVGQITVTGTGSKAANWTGDWFVGYAGTGTLAVANGAQVSTGGNMFLGYESGGAGTVNLDGGNVTVGGSTNVGNSTTGATGTLAIAGGSFTTRNLTLASSSTANLDFTGGTLTIDGGTFTNSTGSLTIDGPSAANTPTLRFVNGANSTGGMAIVGDAGFGGMQVLGASQVTNTYARIGDDAGSAGQVSVSGNGSQWTASSDLSVGDYGTGTLTVLNGGKVSGRYGRVGYRTGSEGHVTVAGLGAELSTSEHLWVGEFGIGTLDVENGGKVTTGGPGILALGSGATGEVNVSGPGSQWDINSTLHVGYAGPGTLNVANGGSVDAQYALVGTRLGASGLLAVAGSGSQLTTTYDVSVGAEGGTGTLDISDGGRVQAGRYGFIGKAANSSGQATVAGAGAELVTGDYLSVGWYGTGTLDIQDGGKVTSGRAFVGDRSGSTGQVTIAGAGSEWATGYFMVGYSANGVINIENGGKLDAGYGYVGFSSGAEGLVTVTGAGSQLVTNSSLHLGSSGTGTLNVVNGGTVTIGSSFTVSDGTATVAGLGSELTMATGAWIGSYGTGSLTIEDQGRVQTATDAQVGNGPGFSGHVSISGTGSEWAITEDLSVGYSGIGSLLVENGANLSTGGAGYVGHLAGSEGEVTLTGAGSQWQVAGNLSVGSEAVGRLNVGPGSRVATGLDATVGDTSASEGHVSVSGPGSQWTVGGQLRVANEGLGTLNVANGGSVTTGSYTHVGFQGSGTLNVEGGGKLATDQLALIATLAGSQGNATVTGPGSEWTVSGNLMVGNMGTGELSVADGGKVATASYGTLGYAAGSEGLVTVTGTGSQLTTVNTLGLGYYGNGTLQIQEGGKVASDTFAVAGVQAGSQGSIAVNGAGSEFVAGNILSVGLYGNGVLTIEDGGRVATGGGAIALRSTSTGNATLTGAGSSWDVAGDLTVGGDGTAALSVGTGTTVTVGNQATVGSSSSVHVLGGTLDVTNTITNDGLMEIATGGVVKASALSGGGTVINNGMLYGDCLGEAGAILAGSGILIGDLDLGAGSLVSPGNSPGTINVLGNSTWAGGSGFLFEINDALGTAGSDPGWDFLALSGALDITATASDPFLVDVASLTLANAPGELFNFDSTQSYSWSFLTADGGISGFLPDAFLVNTDGFQNAIPGGTFFVSQEGNGLNLNFTSAVPEPSSAVIFGILTLLGLAGYRWRRLARPGKSGV